MPVVEQNTKIILPKRKLWLEEQKKKNEREKEKKMK